MSYRCGIGPGIQRLGIDVCRPARFTCDGCGMQRPVVNPTSSNMMPPKWFFAGKSPPGWRGVRMHDGSKRWDLCPRCWKAPEKTSSVGDGE